MKELILGLFVILMLAQNANAQKRTVIGTVKAQEERLPLADVTIKIFGALKDSITNSDGEFFAELTSGNASTTFSYSGYLSQTEIVDANTIFNAVLAIDVQDLSGVIVNAIDVQRNRMNSVCCSGSKS